MYSTALFFLLLCFYGGICQDIAQETTCIVSCFSDCLENSKEFSQCICMKNVSAICSKDSINGPTSSNKSIPMEAYYHDAHIIRINSVYDHSECYVYVLEWQSSSNDSWNYASSSPKSQFQFSIPNICDSYRFRILALHNDGSLINLGQVTPDGTTPDFVIEKANLLVHNFTYNNVSQMASAYVNWKHPFGYLAQDIRSYSLYMHPVRCFIPETFGLSAPPEPKINQNGGVAKIEFPAIMIKEKCIISITIRAQSVCSQPLAREDPKFVNLDCVKIKIDNYPCQKADIPPACLREVTVAEEASLNDGQVGARLSWQEPRFGTPLYYHVRVGTPVARLLFLETYAWQMCPTSTNNNKVDGAENQLALALVNDGSAFGVQVCAIYSTDLKTPDFDVATVNSFHCNCPSESCTCAKTVASAGHAECPAEITTTAPSTQAAQLPSCTYAVPIETVRGSRRENNISVTVSWNEPVDGRPLMYLMRHGPTKETQEMFWKLPRGLERIKISPIENEVSFEIEIDDFPHGVSLCAVAAFSPPSSTFIPQTFAFDCKCEETECSCAAQNISTATQPSNSSEPNILTHEIFVNAVNFTQTVYLAKENIFAVMIDWSLPEGVAVDDVIEHVISLVATQPCDGQAMSCCKVAQLNNKANNDSNATLLLPMQTIDVGCEFDVQIKSSLTNGSTVMSRAKMDMQQAEMALMLSGCEGLECEYGCDRENNKCACPDPERYVLSDNQCIYINPKENNQSYESINSETTTTTEPPVHIFCPVKTENITTTWVTYSAVNITWQTKFSHFDQAVLRWGEIRPSDLFYEYINDKSNITFENKVSWLILPELNSSLLYGFDFCLFDSSRASVSDLFLPESHVAPLTLGHPPLAAPTPESKVVNPMVKLALLIVLPISALIILLSVLALVCYFKWPVVLGWCEKCRTKSYKPYAEQRQFTAAAALNMEHRDKHKIHPNVQRTSQAKTYVKRLDL